MTRRRTDRTHHHMKTCAFCGGLIPEKRPVFLVAEASGGILGPYHAGCAERLALAHKGAKSNGAIPGTHQGRIILPPREETLPW
jgi:hypothetical protein